MAVDPFNKDILLFTKNHEHHESMVFKVPHGSGDPKTLEYVTTLPYKLVDGADISPSGDTLGGAGAREMVCHGPTSLKLDQPCAAFRLSKRFNVRPSLSLTGEVLYDFLFCSP